MKKTLILMAIEALVCVALIFGMRSCEQRKIRAYENNIEALQDTIHVRQTRYNGALTTIKGYELENKQLTDFLELSNKEKRELEKTLQAKLRYISQLEGQIGLHDTIVMVHDSVIYVGGLATMYYFSYNDDWISMRGISHINPPSTSLTYMNIPLDLQVGMTDNNDIFVTTKNPYITITSLQGAHVAEKPNRLRLRLGLQAGLGVVYGLRNGFDLGPYLGGGLNLSWGK